MRAIVRCLIVALTICSWLAISNHCAFSAVAAKQVETGCPFHSKPSKPQSQPTQCCKILRALAATHAKNPAPTIVDLPDVDLAFAERFAFAPTKIFFLPATLDTGPPGKTSFTELNRSMRAHAPPVLS